MLRTREEKQVFRCRSNQISLQSYELKWLIFLFTCAPISGLPLNKVQKSEVSWELRENISGPFLQNYLNNEHYLNYHLI
mgnify:CR=1 FL=1